MTYVHSKNTDTRAVSEVLDCQIFSAISGCPVATDSVITIANLADMFWMLDAIGSHQKNPMLDPRIQAWKLESQEDTGEWVLKGSSGGRTAVVQTGRREGFILDGLILYVVNGVILHPSELREEVLA